MLRHRGVPGGSATPHCRQPEKPGFGRPRRRTGQAGGVRTRVRLRDYACAFCRRTFASRPDHAGTRRGAER